MAGALQAFAGVLADGGRFKAVGLLSRGTFGSVVLAEDCISGQFVALKFLDRAQVASGQFAEAEVLNHCILHHPHVIQLLEVFLTSHWLVLVLEYAPLGDLSRAVPRSGLPEEQARWLFLQILFSLDYCHSMGVACRDVKLENVLVTGDPACPVLKLADFGLSTQSRGAGRHHGVVGTPIYLAPEVLISDTSLGGRPYCPEAADCWSLGVLLYILLTGISPFQRREDASLAPKERAQVLFKRILQVDYAPLPASLSPECRSMLSSLLVGDAGRRLSAREALAHPWCAAGPGPHPAVLLEQNRAFVAASRANTPAPEILREVHSILLEARMYHPRASPSTQQAPKAPKEEGAAQASANRQAYLQPVASGSLPQSVSAAASTYTIQRLGK